MPPPAGAQPTPLPLHPSYNLPLGRPILLLAEASRTYFLFDHALLPTHPTFASLARTTSGDVIVRIPVTSGVLKFALDTLRYRAHLSPRVPFLRTSPASIEGVIRLDALGFPYILQALSAIRDQELHPGWRFTLAVLAKDARGVDASWTRLVLHQADVTNCTDAGWYDLLGQHATAVAHQVDALFGAWNTHRANCNRHINRILATWHGRCGHTDARGRLVPRKADWAKFIPRTQVALCVNGVADDKLYAFRKALRGVHCQKCQDYLTCAITREWLIDRSQRKFDDWHRGLLESLQLS